MRRSTKTVGGGFDHFVKTNKINTNLKKVYNDQNNKDNGKLIIEAFGEVLSMFDKTKLIGTVLCAVAGLDTEPSNGKFAIYYKAFYDMQIVYYAGLPMVYHQVKSLSAGIFDAGTEKSILSTIDKGKDKYVDVSYGIKNHSDDKALIKFGSPYYMKRKGPYSNVHYYDFSEFAFKNKSYTAKV